MLFVCWIRPFCKMSNFLAFPLLLLLSKCSFFFLKKKINFLAAYPFQSLYYFISIYFEYVSLILCVPVKYFKHCYSFAYRSGRECEFKVHSKRVRCFSCSRLLIRCFCCPFLHIPSFSSKCCVCLWEIGSFTQFI